MKHLIAPSILAADFGKLSEEIIMLNNSEADWVHVDVMDGRFVPNISFGFPVIKAMQAVTTKPLDVHLMIVEPEKYLSQFKDVGAHVLTVHYEACKHLHRTIQQIKDLDVMAGVALNPHTPIHVLECVIQELDLVCLMSVNPGFGGQKFIEHTYTKVRQLKELIQQSGSGAIIEIDGGVSANNAAGLLKAGADVLVAGSSVFKASQPNEMIASLKAVDSNLNLA